MGPLSLFPGSYFLFNSWSFSSFSPNICKSSISHHENSSSEERWSHLLRVVKVLECIGHEIRFGGLVVLKDVIVSFHDELLCQLVLATAGIGTAAGSEAENMSSTEGMRPCSRGSRER